jgi:hypothetical protein
MRHRSAARLSHARAENVEAWTRFLIELQKLGHAMIDWERMRRRLENLDATLDEEEAHERELLRINREREIKEAKRARDGGTATTEQRERAKLTPEERIRQGVEKRQRLREACDAFVNEILEAARASGTENTSEVQREIDNIKADFAREISKTYEKS